MKQLFLNVLKQLRPQTLYTWENQPGSLNRRLMIIQFNPPH